jgi:hypothetical protein
MRGHFGLGFGGGFVLAQDEHSARLAKVVE